MRGGGASLEACRTTAVPKVRACVESALKAANGRANVPVAIPSEPVPRESREVGSAATPPGAFIAPPRTISDITAILDSEKPDPKLIDELKAKADAQLPTKGSPAELARLYYGRGNARAQLGRLNDAVADANKAIELGRGAIDANLMARLAQFAGIQYSAAGDPKKAFEIFSREVRDANAPGAKGYLFNGYRQISAMLIQMGDIAQAEAYLRRNISLIEEARTSGIPNFRSRYAAVGQSWEADVEHNRAIIFEARGQFRDAEISYRIAEQRQRVGIKGILSSPNPPPEAQLRLNIDTIILSLARTKARQGRLAEAEADARRALLGRLQSGGKYNPATPRFVMGLAGILIEQGRYGEAEALTRVGIDINRVVGVSEDSQSTAAMLSALGTILNLQRKFKEAAPIYAELDRAIAGWAQQRRETLEFTSARVYSLYASGQTEAGITAAQKLLQRSIARVGESHLDTATARGTLAVGYMRAGRDADANREFKAAIPSLIAAARENADDEDTTLIAARTERLQNIVESYIRLLARRKDDPGSAVPIETFQLAETIRGHSVQQALAASSARMIAKDPALAVLVRKEQDLVKQVNAGLGTLNQVLTLPAAERDENGVKTLNDTINRLRVERDKARAEIGRRFPSYADLIDPKAPTADSTKEALKPGEVLVSFYFGRDSSFVWAVPKEGPVAFAPIAITAGEIETKVRKLREALEPQAEMISDIPSFDLALAYELYELLLGPVEAAWKPAKSLILVTNSALGLLPLSLLPTASVDVKPDQEPLFAGYRAVPWLARTHAVTTLPSVAALRTLRQLPNGSDARERLIGFGDPIFSRAQAEEAARDAEASIQVAVTTRGLPLNRRSSPRLEGVDNAELALLPRLPDTAEELKSIALALQVDPAKVLNLGIMANERTVKTTDLSQYKIVVFATHGLAPGELNGLTQPALALSAPDVAGIEGDGLLTMEEILGLKLDADWVVLSACNTGTGAGAGAEAASGLGRAFFYAGSRALLVTNWSVQSQSARQLTTELFRRQTDGKLARGEALRQAMIALMDGPGLTDKQGKTVFSYAHPLFWAPYTIIGDGG